MLDALGVQARVALLKGRNHYLCRAKLRSHARRTAHRSQRNDGEDVGLGRAHPDGRPRRVALRPAARRWEQLDADADDCVGEFCESFRDCHFFARRDEAKFADLVVVNHALFFLDLAMGGALLPPTTYAVLDEAHQCERWAGRLYRHAFAVGRGPASAALAPRVPLPASYDAEIDEAMRAPAVDAGARARRKISARRERGRLRRAR